MVTYRISARALRHVCPRLSALESRQLARDLGQAMRAEGIRSKRAAAMFIAQTAHESGQYRWRTELWGPTPVQRGYWRRTRDLGNWLPFHGKRYRGRGFIQITGRRNYKAVSKALGVSFTRDPDRLARQHWAARSAAWWFRSHGLVAMSETPDPLVRVTRRINGGTNGLADRRTYYGRALEVAAGLVPRKESS